MASIPDCTLVTACYDLSKYAKNARSKQDTINLIDSLFSVPVYFVIYCDKELESIVRETRAKHNLSKLTKIIVQDFEDLWCYKLLDRVKQNMVHLKKIQCERTFAERYLIFYNKISFVKQTIEINPFNTNYFGWIDSGLGKNCNKLCEDNFMNLILTNLKYIPNKFHLQITNVQDKKFKFDEYKKEYYDDIRWVMVGSFYTTPIEVGLKIFNRMEEIIQHTLELGFVAGDEHIYLEILDEFYDDIYRSYGDYQQTLHNYLKPVKNLVYIYWNIVMKYFDFGYYRECIDCCYSIISSFDDYKTEPNPDMYVRIYSVLYLSLLKYNPNQAEIVGDTIRKYYSTNPIFKNNFDNLRYLVGMGDFKLELP